MKKLLAVLLSIMMLAMPLTSIWWKLSEQCGNLTYP